jgi:hypothetical protein
VMLKHMEEAVPASFVRELYGVTCLSASYPVETVLWKPCKRQLGLTAEQTARVTALVQEFHKSKSLITDPASFDPFDPSDKERAAREVKKLSGAYINKARAILSDKQRPIFTAIYGEEKEWKQ